MAVVAPETAPETKPAPTLREHIAAEIAPAEMSEPAAPVVPPPHAPAAAAAPSVTPEEEADSLKADAELSDAARKLRSSRADKRAERIRKENDELARELHRRQLLRSELERSAPAPRSESEPVASAHRGTLDPSDPEPVETDFPEYGAFVRAQAQWAAREEIRRTTVSQARIARQRTSQRDIAATATKLDAMADTGREKYADFDAVVDTFIGPLRDTPKGLEVGAYLAELSDDGHELAYRIGKDPALAKAVIHAPNRVALYRALANAEQAITAAKTAAKPVTKAPAPPSETVGGATTATVPADSGSLRDHIRSRNRELQEARSLGLVR